MPIPPFGSPPYKLTQAKIAAAGGALAVPVVMTQNFALPANSQTLFRIPITGGSFQIVGGAGSVLVGV